MTKFFSQPAGVGFGPNAADRSLQDEVLQTAREAVTNDDQAVSIRRVGRPSGGVRGRKPAAERAKQFVADRPEQAALAGVAVGAIAMGLLRHLLRKRSPRPGKGTA